MPSDLVLSLSLLRGTAGGSGSDFVVRRADRAPCVEGVTLELSAAVLHAHKQIEWQVRVWARDGK